MGSCNMEFMVLVCCVGIVGGGCLGGVECGGWCTNIVENFPETFPEVIVGVI